MIKQTNFTSPTWKNISNKHELVSRPRCCSCWVTHVDNSDKGTSPYPFTPPARIIIAFRFHGSLTQYKDGHRINPDIFVCNYT